MPSEECASCHAPIYWAEKSPLEINPKTGRPKTNPINADSIDDPKGNLEVWTEDIIPAKGGRAWAMYFRYRKKTDGPLPEGHHLATSHFANCPQAPQWRGRRQDVAPGDKDAGRRRGPKPAAVIVDDEWPPGSHGEAANR